MFKLLKVGPYPFDVVRIDEPVNDDPMAGIERDGIVIYTAEDTVTLA